MEITPSAATSGSSEVFRKVVSTIHTSTWSAPASQAAARPKISSRTCFSTANRPKLAPSFSTWAEKPLMPRASICGATTKW